MSGKTIATLYFYLISVIGLILIIIGIFNGVNFAVNSTQYDQYPLRYGSFGCENYSSVYKPMPVTVDSAGATPSAQELQRQKETCERQQALDSKQHRLDDIKNFITFTLIGIVLFLIHFPQAKKFSKE